MRISPDKNGDKTVALDPEFRKKINDTLKAMTESIEMLYELAIRDEKTGLYNSQFFDHIMNMEVEKAKRNMQKLSLIVVDIDFFKKVNDKYGHVKADELLNRIARVMEKQIRKSDVLARFGGEEFFILLPETTVLKARKLAVRLKNSVKRDTMLKRCDITVSIGATEYKNKDSKKGFMKRADKAMYSAKTNGRDRVDVI